MIYLQFYTACVKMLSEPFLGVSMLDRDKKLILDEKIEKMLGDEGIVGCSVALTDKSGIVYARGFGVRNSLMPESLSDENSIYRAASVTKIVTGILTMRLVEDGKLELDAPVRGYLPWLTLSDPDSTERITLRHLMSHTSGLAGEYTPEGPLDEGMLLQSLKEGLPTVELKSKPGDGEFLYSNWGIRLLSAAIEAVAGERYSALARRLVLEPLGMADSDFFKREDMTGKISMPHSKSESGEPIPESYIKENYCRLATGGLYSSAKDLTALARLILNGGVAGSGERLITERSLSEMMRTHAVMKSGDTYGITLMGHHSTIGTVYGHTGNATPYTSSMYADVEHGYGAAVMLNTWSAGLRSAIADEMLRVAIE